MLPDENHLRQKLPVFVLLFHQLEEGEQQLLDGVVVSVQTEFDHLHEHLRTELACTHTTERSRQRPQGSAQVRAEHTVHEHSDDLLQSLDLLLIVFGLQTRLEVPLLLGAHQASADQQRATRDRVRASRHAHYLEGIHGFPVNEQRGWLFELRSGHPADGWGAATRVSRGKNQG